MKAHESVGYDDIIKQAVELAAAGTEAAVDLLEGKLTVRAAIAPQPVGAHMVCVAQRWDEKTVQLRYTGAHSEWVKA